MTRSRVGHRSSARWPCWDDAGPADRTHPRFVTDEDLLTFTSGLAYGFSVSGPLRGLSAITAIAWVPTLLAWQNSSALHQQTWRPGDLQPRHGVIVSHEDALLHRRSSTSECRPAVTTDNRLSTCRRAATAATVPARRQNKTGCGTT